MSVIQSLMASVTLGQEVSGSVDPDILCDYFVSLLSSQETRLKYTNSFGYSCTVVSKLCFVSYQAVTVQNLSGWF
jgi:hypothetical protein